jgi:hypothetical protein
VFADERNVRPILDFLRITDVGCTVRPGGARDVAQR